MSDEFRLAWLRHQSTKALRKQLSEQHQLAHVALVNKAKQSSDPEVTKAYARWIAMGEALDAMKDVPDPE